MAGRTKKKKFPEIKKGNEGKFTAWVKSNMLVKVRVQQHQLL